MNTQEKIKIMQAFVDGKVIQVTARGGDWVDMSQLDNPGWNWHGCTYRIKPESKVIWVNEGEVNMYVFSTEEEACRDAGPALIRTAIKYQEVIEK